MKRLVVLGSTGSVGRQVLDVVRQNPDNFTILGLSNGNNSKLLSKQIQEFSPKYVNTLGDLDEKSSNVTSVELNKLVTLPDVDLIVHAMSGSHGLMPVLIALEHGKDIALANKEPIV
ncbi:MAG: 1-deoxy-D-xylulose-5-phosphate reductoisomerase, partial [SAR202 cluster bacterium]|nr:1-deoxy-D-xylulose-5-phosphate reductoisomerase [SAR202 cluster bacterium]